VLSNTNITVEKAFGIAVQVRGGVTPYHISWNGLPAGCASTNATTLKCTPTEAGEFNVSVTVVDALGRAVTGPAVFFTISGAVPSLVVYAPTASNLTIELGGSTTLTVEIQGGVPPYTIYWNGLPKGCVTSNSATVKCTPVVEGTFSISVTAIDSVDHTTTGPYLNILVEPRNSQSNTTPNSLTSTDVLALGIAAGVVVALVVVVLIFRNRGRRTALQSATLPPDQHGLTPPNPPENLPQPPPGHTWVVEHSVEGESELLNH
jgi:hypothetical protein